MSDNYIEVKKLNKKFSNFQLKDISFKLPKGYIMGFVGPNGSGKTTTISLILNMLNKDSGKILLFGKDNLISEDVLKQDIGVVFDSSFYVDSWTIEDVEKANALFYKEWNHNTFEEMINRFELPKKQKISVFSKGMQMKLMLSCAFSHNAKLLILDEPTSGLDPVTRNELLELLQEYIKDGEKSVLFSSHITTDLESICDYITFINKGNIIFTGSMEDFLNKYRVIKGKLKDLTKELEKEIIGIRKSHVGFEGLITTDKANLTKGFIIEKAKIDNIIIALSKVGD